MAAVIQLLQLASDLGFILLGLAATRAWFRRRDPSGAWLAVALDALAVVVLLSLAEQATGYLIGQVGEDVAVIAFLVSGYAMLRFRGTFIPVDRRVDQAAMAALVVLAIAGVVVNIPYRPGGAQTGIQFAVVLALILYWAATVGDPVVRFWLAARGRPRVQRARLRALSAGYAAIIVVLVFAVAAAGLSRSPVGQLLTSLITVATVPLIYVAFEPPRWLRREWREPEEERLRHAIRDLLLFSPTRRELAERAIEWAPRLVGADAGFVVDADGEVLAVHGIGVDAALEIVDEVQTRSGVTNLADGRTVVIERLTLSTGEGLLVVIAGRFTPFFGTDEIDRLGQYATNLIAGLDRVLLTERLQALERTKTEFLNLASHELRGPVTVLRGYLAMIAAGTLGEVPLQFKDVLPILVAKTDEMNALVEQMIEAARLEEGRLELHRERADLREVAKRAVEMVRPLTDARHPVVIDEPRHEVKVDVDFDRVVTIVNNLLSNAIKYSPEGGEVRLEVDVDDDLAEVRVRDSGVGIAPTDMERLFTRFGRIVTPETQHISGTGLGLYLSRELARMHGGDLFAESEVGKGSTFVLRVPMAAADA